MDWKAANEQRQDAVLRVFYMLVVMVLLIIRPRLDARAALAGFPPKGVALPGCAPAISPYVSLSAHRRAVLMLLCAAEAAVRRLDDMARAVYQLMNQADTLARSVRGAASDATRLVERTSERLDTS